jgi:hypothetical protein
MDRVANLLLERGELPFETEPGSFQPRSQGTSSYQMTLPALGAWLDAHAACHITLREAIDGFTVHGQRWPKDAASLTLHLSSKQVCSLGMELDRYNKQHRHSGTGHQPRQNSYQQLLRAVGIQLDLVAAQRLVLYELDDGRIRITYQVSAEGGTWREQTTVLSPQELIKETPPGTKEQKRSFWRLLRSRAYGGS